MQSDTLVTHIMAINPATVEVGQTLAEVRQALSGEQFHHLPVVDDGRVVGLISSTDLLKLGLGDDASEGSASLEKRLEVSDLMQKDVITISHRATIEEAARLLSAGGFHGLPIVDEDQHLKGLVTSTDLINFLLEASPPPEAPPEILERLKVLERVLNAVERYLHSGHAGAEHVRLEKALLAARSLK